MALGFELRGVGRAWGQRSALSGIDLSIAAGERIALVGPSGSGKTTLLRLLAGSLRPSSGQILVNDTPLAELSPSALRKHRARCGFVHQGPVLVPGLSVHANVVAGCLPQWPWWRIAASLLWPVERTRVRALLADVGLADRQWDETSTLSGGQQQRVAIARALAVEHQAILADEPTASLDPRTAQEVTEVLLERTRTSEATLIFCTHWLSLVIGHADRVIGLREGRILIDRPTREVTEADLDALYAGPRG